MQTPLQRLIEIIGWRKTAGEELELPDSDPGMIQINLALRDATELLEKERDAVTLAYFDGVTAGINQDKQEVISPSKYFEQNYS